jgi:hypothetical protein
VDDTDEVESKALRRALKRSQIGSYDEPCGDNSLAFERN